ncbi:MAG: aminoacyl-tRNA hydrolase [Bacteroidales bacterium]|nr:aminoacyl-tRNA hydrolase [Bacteroidales bacterium]
MKFLIAGLGNIGNEYQNTRHNIGFKILDALAASSNIHFSTLRFGALAEYKYKGRILILLKPSTYVNLSGKAVRYWLRKEHVSIENLLVIIDDIALPFGKIRLRPHGSDGGHNGLLSINQILGHQDYARLRFGIGSEYEHGLQVDYVLSEWSDEQNKILPERIRLCHDVIHSYVTVGIEKTMNLYNSR